MSPAGRTSRRSVLRAAVALGALAVAGVGASGCSRGPDGAVLDDGVLGPRPDGSRPRWRLAVPEGRSPRGLVVALHGFGGDADSAFDLGYGDAVAATGLALASVDGGNTYWHARRDGADSGAMVRDELIPLVLSRCGLPAGSRVGLLGWSMGGFGALLLAGELGAARVDGVVAASAALWKTAGETPAVAFDGRADFERHSVFGRVKLLAGIPVRLDCGESDPFIRANRALAGQVPGVETHFEPGGHEDGWWRDHAAAEMQWLAARTRA
ncbi:alpha/beta hydrolase-fold protein [Terrabacter sp. NPDC080008]|uniref:alpha/beta hydrolase-fold protein n=1 Tax=Terrabacter sp. NPDC080008 TaxID=3155176 RepID=UPI00344E2035